MNVALNPNKNIYDKFLPLEDKVQEWLDTPVGFLDTELQPTYHLDMALNGSSPPFKPSKRGKGTTKFMA